MFEAAHLAVGAYAVVIVWLGSREKRRGLGMGRVKNGEIGGGSGLKGATEGKTIKRVWTRMKGTGISGMWAVPVVYGLIAGLEGVLAGSVVGLLWVHSAMIPGEDC